MVTDPDNVKRRKLVHARTRMKAASKADVKVLPDDSTELIQPKQPDQAQSNQSGQTQPQPSQTQLSVIFDTSTIDDLLAGDDDSTVTSIPAITALEEQNLALTARVAALESNMVGLESNNITAALQDKITALETANQDALNRNRIVEDSIKKLEEKRAAVSAAMKHAFDQQQKLILKMAGKLKMKPKAASPTATDHNSTGADSA